MHVCHQGGHPNPRLPVPHLPTPRFEPILLPSPPTHHCSFQHTLGDPPVAADPPPPTDWWSLPPELVVHVASFLDKAQDLLNLSATCRDALCACCTRLHGLVCCGLK